MSETHRDLRSDPCKSGVGNSLRRFWNKYKFVGCFGLLFAVLLYSFMMSQQLTNTFDGLWEQNYHRAGKSELSSGRWLLAYVDKLVMGLHGDPIASVSAIFLYTLGFVFVLDLLEVRSRLWGCISIALFLSSTAISNTLSYRFTSLNYGLSYFLAVLGVYVAVRVNNPFVSVGLSGLFLGLSMSAYQAYSAVFCTVALFYLIFLLWRGSNGTACDKKAVCFLLLRLFCALLVGAGVYISSLSVFLHLNQSALSSYNGIGEISANGFFRGLPSSIRRSYLFFGAYFLRDRLKINCLEPLGIFYIFLALLAAVLLVIGITFLKKEKWKALFLIPAVLLIPIACNAYMLIAGNKLELQMTAGMAMLLPLTMLLASQSICGKKLLRGTCIVLCIALLYGNSMQVWLDQEAMYEGRNACQSMMTRVIGDLQSKDLLSQEYEYFFVGVPVDNPFFYVSENFELANAYAQVGNFWVSGYCCQVSYEGLISKYMGINLPMHFRVYEQVAATPEVAEMPLYPQAGYITKLNEKTILIKIGEYKDYTGFSKYTID
ncbi:MAG: glucosyltransferase domain-containing protein [Oscillospiraceae bacterium]|nr:glucosyltransferase domain-containing protein [Oscillospiraceae bacterium]